ncbi:hypothetical protein LOD99_14867 [Oopsacas minuta]|uniref:Uncharacterized protein n=1 Tax=Oopsacas minuta TaxID=111878 RepID=A0AAV7KDA4_9METZ|nr:hypothetical protein LOD99_14867 [Oopsacas minuta]
MGFMTAIILYFALQSVYCYNDDDDDLELVQRISSYVGLAILMFVVIYICGCIVAVLYFAWKGRCRWEEEEEEAAADITSVVDIRPPNYNDIFKGRQLKCSTDSSELPAYDAVVMGNYPFPVNSRSLRRASRASVSSNQNRSSVVMEV